MCVPAVRECVCVRACVRAFVRFGLQVHPKQPATFFNDYPSPCGGGMPPCGSDGSLPSRPQWTALFDIVLSVFECMCIFSLFYYYSLVFMKKKK